MRHHVQLYWLSAALLLAGCTAPEDDRAASDIDGDTVNLPAKSVAETNTAAASYSAAEDVAWLARARTGTLPAPIAAAIKPRCRLLAAEINGGMHRRATKETDPVDEFLAKYSEDAPVEFVENPQTLTDEELAEAKRQNRAVLRSLCEELGFIRRAGTH